MKNLANNDVLTPLRIIVIKKKTCSEEVHKYVTDDFTLRKKKLVMVHITVCQKIIIMKIWA